MPNISLTLDPDELAKALALTPGGTMTLSRAFDPQPERDAEVIDQPTTSDGGYVFTGRIRFGGAKWIPSPLGQPGDVLVCDVICVDDERQYRPMPPPEHSYGVSPTYSFRLTVLSVDVKLADGTWVAEVEVREGA